MLPTGTELSPTPEGSVATVHDPSKELGFMTRYASYDMHVYFEAEFPSIGEPYTRDPLSPEGAMDDGAAGARRVVVGLEGVAAGCFGPPVSASATCDIIDFSRFRPPTPVGSLMVAFYSSEGSESFVLIGKRETCHNFDFSGVTEMIETDWSSRLTYMHSIATLPTTSKHIAGY